jgi:hypothetical protein
VEISYIPKLKSCLKNKSEIEEVPRKRIPFDLINKREDDECEAQQTTEEENFDEIDEDANFENIKQNRCS